MSLLRKIEQVKNKYKDVEKITSATISTEITKEGDDNNPGDVWGIYLDINAPFKMLTIEYIGNINIVNDHQDLHITNSRNRVTIYNNNSINLVDSLLLEYGGKIAEFKKVVAYGWGQQKFAVSKITPSETSFNINNNENIVSTSDIKFYGGGQ